MGLDGPVEDDPLTHDVRCVLRAVAEQEGEDAVGPHVRLHVVLAVQPLDRDCLGVENVALHPLILVVLVCAIKVTHCSGEDTQRTRLCAA